MYTPTDLIRMSKQPHFNIGSFSFYSQQPDILADNVRTFVVPHYLPQFFLIWNDIEAVTGVRWKCTSYLRDSPSHGKGQAFDLAPDIAANSRGHYAVYQGSDPVLYKRQELVSRLQKLRNKSYSRTNGLGIFIEPDHLHIQVLSKIGLNFPTVIAKWGVPKPIYADTYDRMKLGVFKTQ